MQIKIQNTDTDGSNRAQKENSTGILRRKKTPSDTEREEATGI